LALTSVAADAPERVAVPAMKTSIYVGSVTLSTSDFVRDGETYAADYEARVFPWAFWNETGTIMIDAPEEQMKRLHEGETIELTGAATNHKNKPRTVSIKATPGETPGGRIKVRIKADGVELIFNGDYTTADSQEPAVE
jgi:hypothetical protein